MKHVYHSKTNHPSLLPTILLWLLVGNCLASPADAQWRSKKKKQLKDTGTKLFTPTDNASDPSASARNAWSIVLVTFRGQNHAQNAAKGLWKVQNEASLSDAYTQKRSEQSTIIAFGQFADPSSPEAQSALARVKNTLVNNARPFASAFLAPPSLTLAKQTLDRYDLRNAKKLHGAKDNTRLEYRALYTLQVGVYTRLDRNPTPQEIAEFRKIAENAAAILRQEGELAFFYHGITKSMVTVGIFGTDDFDPQNLNQQSPALTATRNRFPYNLLNGKAYRNNLTGKLQQSGLVNIP